MGTLIGRGLAASVAMVLGLGMVTAPPAEARPGTFVDDDRSLHEPYIEAAARAGLVRGCNPPIDDRFCPYEPVTREQAAALLARALDLDDEPARDWFEDDTSSAFASDIDRLAQAGVVRGCTPTRFCPGEALTRGEMATFLVRAFSLGPTEAPLPYTDIGDSVHQADIARLAAAGVADSCDPPAGSRFCPNDPVRRDEAAAFIAKALGLSPVVAAERPPPESSLLVHDDFADVALWNGVPLGGRNRVRPTEDGFRGPGMRVTLAAGSHYGADFRYDFSHLGQEEPESLYFRYFLRFDPDWRTASNGKLPGFGGVYQGAGKGGSPSRPGSPGWSARMEFFAPAGNDHRTTVGYYVYHLGQGGSYGDGLRWNEAGRLVPGQWYCVEGYVALNTPGEADGMLRGWTDGTPAFAANGLEFRRPDEGNVRIESFWFNVYYGGNAVPSEDLGMTFDELAVSDQRVGCGAGPGLERPVVGDLDGDGLPDLVTWEECPWGACLAVRRGSEQGFRPASEWGAGAWSSLETHELGLLVADLSGDGRDDVVYRGRCEGSEQCWRAHLARGQTFARPRGWGDGARFTWATEVIGVGAGDLDGDGRDDLVYRGWCGDAPGRPCWRVHRSAGDRFHAPEDWGESAAFPEGGPAAMLVGDVTGDGLADLVYPGRCDGPRGCWIVQPSMGDRFGEPQPWGPAGRAAGSDPVLADLDGDGYLDLLFRSECEEGPCLVVRRNDGRRFGPPEHLGEVPAGQLAPAPPGGPVRLVVAAGCPDGDRCGAAYVLGDHQLVEVEVWRQEVARQQERIRARLPDMWEGPGLRFE